MDVIPHNKPSLGEEEIQAVEAVIKSKWIIANKEVERFENSIKEYAGMQYAVALNSGHAALHLSLLALGVGEGDEIILPAYTTPDLLNVIYYCNAKPVIVDTIKEGFVIDPEKIQEKLTERTKAMIIPHILGFVADMDRIKQYNIPVIEDCAQAIGSTYKNNPVGSAGDISIFSFFASKLITTGQGGMVLTNNEDFYKTFKDLIDYNGAPTYRVRYNYPMTDIAAAMGNAQFKKLHTFIEKRKSIAAKYSDVLQAKNVHFWPKENDTVNHFRFIIKLENESEVSRVKDELLQKGIKTIVPYNSYELPHNILQLDKNEYQNTEEISRSVLSIPIFTDLTNEEVERITTALSAVI